MIATLNDAHPNVHERRPDSKRQEHDNSDRKYRSLSDIRHTSTDNNQSTDKASDDRNKELSELFVIARPFKWV